jgi:hypothetical protein
VHNRSRGMIWSGRSRYSDLKGAAPADVYGI